MPSNLKNFEKPFTFTGTLLYKDYKNQGNIVITAPPDKKHCLAAADFNTLSVAAKSCGSGDHVEGTAIFNPKLGVVEVTFLQRELVTPTRAVDKPTLRQHVVNFIRQFSLD